MSNLGEVSFSKREYNSTEVRLMPINKALMFVAKVGPPLMVLNIHVSYDIVVKRK